MDRYAEMTREQLFAELEAWSDIVDAPKGPDHPSNAARRAAERHIEELAGWIARREMEEARK